MTIEEVADELYALRPGDFTAARNARAAAARAAGDRELAGDIGKLRRPTRGAWLVNATVRARPDLADALVRLGGEMRAAQEQLAGDELRRLSQRRGRLVQELTRAAREAAGAAGESVGADVEREVQSTLEAALADPEAGDAVRAGRLATALSYSGLGSVGEAPASPVRAPTGRRATSADAAADVPPPARGRPVAPKPAGADATGAKATTRVTARRQARLEDVREALAAAEAAAIAARREAHEAATRAAAATSERARIARRMEAVESELQSLRASAGEVTKAAAQRVREQAAADRARRLAEERLSRARRDAERAGGG